MPRSLFQRCSDDSVQEFRASAQMRYQEGIVLAEQEHYTAAIYLWGYAAEMILKAAYFKLALPSNDKGITFFTDADRRKARVRAHHVNIPVDKIDKFHHLKMWAELLIRYRYLLSRNDENPVVSRYKEPGFGQKLINHSRQIYCHWRETLRYRSVIAEKSEVLQVEESTKWFIQNSLEM